MTYYIMLPGDDLDSLQFESNLLGTESFNTLWGGSGLKTLMNLVDSNEEDILMEVKIFDDRSNEYTIEEFLKKIEKLKVKIRE